MPTTLPGVSAGDAAVQLRRQDRAIGQFPEVAARVRQGRARRHRDRSGAVLDGRDDHPPAPRAEWPTVPRDALVLGLGARRRSSACSARSGPRRRRDDGRAGREARSRDPPARLDERLDRAGARAHGHDVDGRVRTPWASASSPPNPRASTRSAPRCRRGRRGCPGRAAPCSSRWAASRGWSSTPIRPRWPCTTSIPALVRSTADLVLSGGQVGELSGQDGRPQRHPKRFAPAHRRHGDADAAARQAALPRPRRADMSMKRGDADQLREVTVRSATGRSRSRWRCSGARPTRPRPPRSAPRAASWSPTSTST